MSKFMQFKVTRKFIIVTFGIVLIFCFIGAFGWTKDFLDRRKIDADFKKLTVPTEFIFQNKKWTPLSLDVQEHMEYQFTFEGDERAALISLTTAARDKGFRYDQILDQLINCPVVTDVHLMPITSTKTSLKLDVYDYGSNCTK